VNGKVVAGGCFVDILGDCEIMNAVIDLSAIKNFYVQKVWQQTYCLILT